MASLQLNKIRVIAISRLLLALALLLISMTDPDKIGYDHEPDDLLATAYLVFALGFLVVAWTNWWLDFRLLVPSQIVDLCAFILLPSTFEPWGSGYRVAAILIGAFILIESALRWDWRRCLRVAIAINLLNVLIVVFEPIRLLFHPETMDLGMELGLKIRNFALLLGITLVIAWFSHGFVQLHRRLELSADPGETTLGREEYLLEVAMAAAGAMGGLLCWQPGRSDRCVAIGSGTLAAAAGHADLARCRLSDKHPAFVFDLDRGRAVMQTDDHGWRALSVAELAGAKVSDLPPCSGLTAPLAGITGRGRLVLTDLRALDIFGVRQIAALADQVSTELDRLEFEAAARHAGELELRNTLSHELHDGVAQSLAGACFWLASLRRKLLDEPATVAEIEKVLRALEAESSHVREVITVLRSEPDSIHRIDLGTTIRDFLPRAAGTWGVRASLRTTGTPVRASPSLVFEVQQILREAMSNAARHGRATQIEVEIHGEDDLVHLSIKDNGNGFSGPPPHPLPKMIAERTRKLGGSVEIGSATGHTELRIALPLEEDG